MIKPKTNLNHNIYTMYSTNVCNWTVLVTVWVTGATEMQFYKNRYQMPQESQPPVHVHVIDSRDHLMVDESL